MVKKCIVKSDDLGKPIEVIELKEFHDPKVLKEYKEKCELNKAEYLKRLQEKAENERLEKQRVDNEIKSLHDEIKSLKSVVSHILGYLELEEDEIKEILGVKEDE